MAIAGLLVTKSTYRLSPLTLGLLLISLMLKGGTAWKSDNIKSNILSISYQSSLLKANSENTVAVKVTRFMMVCFWLKSDYLPLLSQRLPSNSGVHSHE